MKNMKWKKNESIVKTSQLQLYDEQPQFQTLIKRHQHSLMLNDITIYHINIWAVFCTISLKVRLQLFQFSKKHSKNTVSTYIKHSRYIHLMSNFLSIHFHTKRLYVHMFDIVDILSWVMEDYWSSANHLRNFSDNRKYLGYDLKCRYCVFTLWACGADYVYAIITTSEKESRKCLPWRCLGLKKPLYVCPFPTDPNVKITGLVGWVFIFVMMFPIIPYFASPKLMLLRNILVVLKPDWFDFEQNMCILIDFIPVNFKGLFPDFGIIFQCHQQVDIHERILYPQF